MSYEREKWEIEKEQQEVEKEERRVKFLDTLKGIPNFVVCGHCPLTKLCPDEQSLASANLFEETQKNHYYVMKSDIEDLIENIVLMKKATENCSLLRVIRA